jgi:hypothetical protein
MKHNEISIDFGCELMVLAISAYVLHLYCTGSSLFAIVIVYRSLILLVLIH